MTNSQYILLLILAAAALWDSQTCRIPNQISLGGWLILFLLHRQQWVCFLFHSMIPGLLLLLVLIQSKGRLGMGDVKLSLSIGGVMGIRGVWMIFLLASLAGLSLHGLRLLAKRPTPSPIPFAPFLFFGCLLYRNLPFFPEAWAIYQ